MSPNKWSGIKQKQKPWELFKYLVAVFSRSFTTLSNRLEFWSTTRWWRRSRDQTNDPHSRWVGWSRKDTTFEFGSRELTHHSKKGTLTRRIARNLYNFLYPVSISSQLRVRFYTKKDLDIPKTTWKQGQYLCRDSLLKMYIIILVVTGILGGG